MADRSQHARELISEPRMPISDEWLAKIGFKWHRFERQPTKHWLLWLGDALRDNTTSREDLGLELAASVSGRFNKHDGWYFCWIRSDASHRYHRFIHTRRLVVRGELLDMIRGLTGQTFDPADVWYGALQTPERAAQFQEQEDRLDLRLMRESSAWYPNEHDDTKGGPLIEHMNVADEFLKQKEGK